MMMGAFTDVQNIFFLVFSFGIFFFSFLDSSWKGGDFLHLGAP
jgi:hypothetical protein